VERPTISTGSEGTSSPVGCVSLADRALKSMVDRMCAPLQATSSESFSHDSDWVHLPPTFAFTLARIDDDHLTFWMLPDSSGLFRASNPSISCCSCFESRRHNLEWDLTRTTLSFLQSRFLLECPIRSSTTRNSTFQRARAI